MSLTVSVLYPGGRRRNSKVAPNCTISQTLEEVCEREKLDAGSYAFLFQRKILDETLSWRYANVPNNAKLELVKHKKAINETPVRIALQYEGGPRLQNAFQPSATLYEILNHWNSELSTLTPPEGQEPSILYVRQEITGNAKLSTTTLKSLGLTSGSAILKLSYKSVTHIDPVEKVKVKKSVEKKVSPRDNVTSYELLGVNEPHPPQRTQKVASKLSGEVVITQEMLQSALEQVSETSMEVTSASSTSSTDFMDAKDELPADDLKNGRARSRRPNSSETMPKKKVKPTPAPNFQPDFSNFHFPKESEGMDVYSQEADESDVDIRPLTQPCEREAIFFDETELENRDINSDDPGDEFFELTVDDMRKMLSELRSVQSESDEKMLMTSRSREFRRLRLINQYPKIVIRIVFPNRKILQGIFRPAETIQSLHTFIMDYLSNPRIDFYLYTTPPKVILKDKKSILYDKHLAPASKVYFGVNGHEFDSKMLSDECKKHGGSAADANFQLQSVFEMKSPIEIQKEPQYHFNGTSSETTSASTSESGAPSTSRQSAVNQAAHPSGARPKVPKWFKIGK